VGNKQCQRRRGNSIDPTRVANRARTMHLQFLFHLVRQSRQRRVVEIVGQLKTFVSTVRCNVRGLAGKIDVVFRINLDLLCDVWRELAEARPNFREVRNRYMWIRQQLERGAALPVFVECQSVTFGFFGRE
jgi:hypothetical protein